MESNQLINNRVSLRDMGLVAALVTAGFPVVRTENKQQRIWFVFQDTERLQITITQYWANELNVPARKLADNLKMLKGRIYSEREQ